MITRKCKQCGKEFTLTDSEIDFYNKKDMHLPKRCKECREVNNPKKQDVLVKPIKIHKNKLGYLIAAVVLAIGIFWGGKYFSLPDNDIESALNGSEVSATTPDFSLNADTKSKNTEHAASNSVTSKESRSAQITEKSSQTAEQRYEKTYKFRNADILNDHFEKHGNSMGFATAEEYEKAAGNVINSPNVLHKTEKEDGDDVYYLEATNEFIIVSTDGYIRTYFKPDDGKDYFDRQ